MGHKNMVLYREAICNGLNILSYYDLDWSQVVKSLKEIVSTTIGIKEWSVPQISEHWP